MLNSGYNLHEKRKNREKIEVTPIIEKMAEF
jgi:hypothetical protein